jgi:dTDP-4-dehydrorhamnose reductase
VTGAGRHRERILLTGANGQLGHELAPVLAALGDVVSTDRASLDLGDADAIVRRMRDLSPTLVVNAAAYTAVDLAEKERDAAFAINARAPQVLAEEAKRCGALLVHYSTDYVFDGAARTPYREDAPTAPLSVYGASKLEGERAIAASGAKALVFRTSWVYGLRGRNFLLTIRRLAAERTELRIVADQVGVPNWSRTLAAATGRVLGQGLAAAVERSGLYHLSCTGDTTWHGVAQAIVGDAPRPTVVAIETREYPTPARRPAYGVLDTARFVHTFGFALPHWRDAFDECVASAADPVRDDVV